MSLCHCASVSLCHHVTLRPAHHSALVPPCHHATVPLCHHATVPLCYHAMVPLCHHATVPLCHWATMLRCHCATGPPCHCATMLRCYCAAMPPCHHTIVPPRHHTTVPPCRCATLPSYHHAIVSPCHRTTGPLTALMLACEHCSLESAELLLSHGAALGDEDRWRLATQTPSRALRRLLRCARRGGRGEPPPPHCHAHFRAKKGEKKGGKKGGLFLFLPAENGNSAPQGEETPSSESEEEEEEDEDEEDEEQRDGCAVRRLRERLARKTRECQRLAATAEGIRQRVRELARLLPGCPTADGTEDEDGACLALLAQHVGELRKRMAEEEEEEGDGGGQTPGDAEVPALLPFLAWLGDECAKMRVAKANAVARSKGLRKEVEEALRSKLHYEVVSAEAVRKSLAAWEKLVVELERALSRADQTHAKMLQGSRSLLENLRREPTLPPSVGKTPSPCPVNGTEPAPGGKSLEKEVVELKESNGRLLGELARLGGERERLQEELRGLREREESGAETSAAGPGVATLARELVVQREEAARLRRRLAGQRRELAALRDGVGERVREGAGGAAGGDAGAGVLRELHLKLDGLVRSQHEALQLVAEMEGDGTGEDGGAGMLGETEGEAGEETGTVGVMEGATGTAATPCGREVAEEVAGRWRGAVEEAKRAAEAAEARAAEREREARELRETAQGLERSLGNLRARAGELATACRDKDGKMKKLLAETEKLSAEVGASTRCHPLSPRHPLCLPTFLFSPPSSSPPSQVQQKNHRDIVAIYRTHLLNAAQVGSPWSRGGGDGDNFGWKIQIGSPAPDLGAPREAGSGPTAKLSSPQGFMDEGVHTMLLHILRTEE
uniref:Ankyrin repeat domain 35 n=1 Tax=Calidris pygmaea TaxID=425635 RepID=A0A8C3JQV5_9CHAR